MPALFVPSALFVVIQIDRGAADGGVPLVPLDDNEAAKRGRRARFRRAGSYMSTLTMPTTLPLWVSSASVGELGLHAEGCRPVGSDLERPERGVLPQVADDLVVDEDRDVRSALGVGPGVTGLGLGQQSLGRFGDLVPVDVDLAVVVAPPGPVAPCVCSDWFLLRFRSSSSASCRRCPMRGPRRAWVIPRAARHSSRSLRLVLGLLVLRLLVRGPFVLRHRARRARAGAAA